MSRPRAVIAEDEDNLREQLRETLSLAWPELEICADGVRQVRGVQHLPSLHVRELAQVDGAPTCLDRVVGDCDLLDTYREQQVAPCR